MEFNPFVMENKMKDSKCLKLNVLGFALAIGVVWGLCTLVAGWFSMGGWASQFVKSMSSMYMGYTSSFWGGVIGGIWGFIDGFIGGLLIAFFYNLFSCKKK